MTFIPKVTVTVETGCRTCHNPLNLAPALGGCGCGSSPLVEEDTTANSPCSVCNEACEDITTTDCTLYSGEDIPQLGIKKGDKLTKVVILLAAEVISLKGRVADLEA